VIKEERAQTKNGNVAVEYYPRSKLPFRGILKTHFWQLILAVLSVFLVYLDKILLLFMFVGFSS